MQLLSHEQAGVSHPGLSCWYQELYDYLLSMGNLEILQQLIQIFNYDETGFLIAPKPPKVICEAGAPNVYACGSSSKQMITTLLCASAAGMYVRPMIVYPGIFLIVNLDILQVAGWTSCCFSNVYIFDPSITAMGIKGLVLLIIDGTQVHLSLWISEFCDEKNIILHVLFPNSTHLTQPLDLSLMGSVKVHYKKVVCKWIGENPFEIYDKFANNSGNNNNSNTIDIWN